MSASRRTSQRNAFSVARETANVASAQETVTNKPDILFQPEEVTNSNDVPAHEPVDNATHNEITVTEAAAESKREDPPKKRTPERKKNPSTLENIFQSESDRQKNPASNYISKSVYFKPETFNKVLRLQEKYGLSLSKIINIIVENANIENLEDSTDM